MRDVSPTPRISSPNERKACEAGARTAELRCCLSSHTYLYASHASHRPVAASWSRDLAAAVTCELGGLAVCSLGVTFADGIAPWPRMSAVC